MLGSRNSLTSRFAQVRLVAGVVATGLLLGAAATLLLRTAGDVIAPGDATAAATAKPAATPTVPVKSPAPSAVPAKPSASSPVAVKPVTRTVAQPASSAPRTASAASVPGVKLGARSATRPAGVQPVAHLDDQITYQYNALGRRDPFMPMIGGEFVGEDVGGDAPVDVGGMKVVGIVWGSTDRFALAEDGKGNSLVLRVGDKVMNGVVEGLRRDAVVVRLTVDGQSQSVAIPLTRKGDRSDANR